MLYVGTYKQQDPLLPNAATQGIYIYTLNPATRRKNNLSVTQATLAWLLVIPLLSVVRRNKPRIAQITRIFYLLISEICVICG
jgi:hypothetical protein